MYGALKRTLILTRPFRTLILTHPLKTLILTGCCSVSFSVANLATLSLDLATFQATNLATFGKTLATFQMFFFISYYSLSQSFSSFQFLNSSKIAYWATSERLYVIVLTHTSQVKSSHLYLYSAFNNTNCNKALHNIKIGKFVNNVK